MVFPLSQRVLHSVKKSMMTSFVVCSVKRVRESMMMIWAWLSLIWARRFFRSSSMFSFSRSRPGNDDGIEADVPPCIVIGDVQAHGLHLGEEVLRCRLAREEVDAETLFHPAPDDLLGEDRFPAVMLPFDEGEGPEGDTIIDLLVDLGFSRWRGRPSSCRLAGRENPAYHPVA